MNGASKPTSLEVGPLLSQAWSIFTKNPGTLLIASIILYVIFAVLAYFTRGIGTVIVSGPLCYGYLVLVLQFVRGKSPELPVMFSGFQRFLPTFLAGLLISILASIGTFLCVLPGLFVGLIYMLTFFCMADRDLGAWAAMEASRQIVMANFVSWLIIWLVLVVLNFVGVLVFGVGILVTMPLSALMLAAAYNQVAPSSELHAE